jgi:hypothetical protein
VSVGPPHDVRRPTVAASHLDHFTFSPACVDRPALDDQAVSDLGMHHWHLLSSTIRPPAGVRKGSRPRLWVLLVMTVVVSRLTVAP